MAVLGKSKRLKKQLGLLSVYAIATGTTLSAGFFLLPGLAAQQAGPAVVLAYLLAAVPLIPATFSIVELATAMPRAGGTYYFLDRSMGPLVGTVGGLGTWLALVLKTAFALIGMGAYVALFVPGISVVPLAVVLALFFGVLNLFGAKASSSLQVALVSGLLAVLAWFMATGLAQVQPVHFHDFFAAGPNAIASTAGMVYISYVGVTTVASVSEEVKDPEQNLPRGIFLAVFTSIVVYTVGTLIMVGVLSAERLSGVLTPVAAVADVWAGRAGVLVVSGAAILAFSSVANAGILTASRYPLAMGRDHLVPRAVGQLGQGAIPRAGVAVTVALVVACLLAFDPTRIAKLASAFQLTMFALICLGVVIMRESRLPSYDPGYRSPLYPYMQIAGMLVPLYLLWQMGWVPVGATLGLMAVCLLWYVYYVRRRTVRSGALLHLFARLGRDRYRGLDTELRSILKEKGVRAGDPIDKVVATATLIEAAEAADFETVVHQAAESLTQHIAESSEWIAQQFLAGTRVGATPVANGVALPHFWYRGLKRPRLVIARSVAGICAAPGDEAWGEFSPEHPIHALFFLVSSETDPGQHLRVLAQIANHVDTDGFMDEWLRAGREAELKELLLREERVLTIVAGEAPHATDWVGRSVRDLGLPEGCLIALVARDEGTIVPRGSTVLEPGDRLTLIGEPPVIRRFNSR